MKLIANGDPKDKGVQDGRLTQVQPLLLVANYTIVRLMVPGWGKISRFISKLGVEMESLEGKISLVKPHRMGSSGLVVWLELTAVIEQLNNELTAKSELVGC